MMKQYTYISTFNRTILQGILIYLKIIKHNTFLLLIM